jgi:hypothetical protein
VTVRVRMTEGKGMWEVKGDEEGKREGREKEAAKKRKR